MNINAQHHGSDYERTETCHTTRNDGAAMTLAAAAHAKLE
jgi:hypothetical protein